MISKLPRVQPVRRSSVAPNGASNMLAPERESCRPYRVAVVAACPFPCGRGTPIRIRRLAEGLAARGHEIDIATYHFGDPVDLQGVRIHRIAPLRRYSRSAPGPTLRKLLVVDPLLVAKLKRLLAERPFDVIHAHHVEGLAVALLARRGRHLPIVFDAHTALESELPYYGPATTRRVLGRVGRAFDRLLPPRADHTITVTTELRARLLAAGSVDPACITVIGNGLEFDLFEEAQRRARARRPGETLVFTGNLATYQGVDLMLEAFALVRERRPDARLRIVSQAAFTPFEALARDLGVRDALDIANVGFEAVPEYLAQADVALNPRLDSPGIAQKTLNYMAMGLPIVSFAGSGRHLVDGETALLAEDGDVRAFASAIIRLLEDRALLHRLGENANRLVREKNDWAQSSEMLERVLERVVEASTGNAIRPRDEALVT
jgi:glycosyltransferase involved in cell wall biosynthesis